MLLGLPLTMLFHNATATSLCAFVLKWKQSGAKYDLSASPSCVKERLSKLRTGCVH